MSYFDVRFLYNERAELSPNSFIFSVDLAFVILWAEVFSKWAISLSRSEKQRRMHVRISCWVILGVLFKSWSKPLVPRQGRDIRNLTDSETSSSRWHYHYDRNT